MNEPINILSFQNVVEWACIPIAHGQYQYVNIPRDDILFPVEGTETIDPQGNRSALAMMLGSVHISTDLQSTYTDMGEKHVESAMERVIRQNKKCNLNYSNRPLRIRGTTAEGRISPPSVWPTRRRVLRCGQKVHLTDWDNTIGPVSWDEMREIGQKELQEEIFAIRELIGPFKG